MRQTTDDILALLRPLTLPPNRTSQTKYSLSEDFLPPLATLSVNTFSSHSYPRAGILGESKTYTSSADISAEFRSIHPSSQESALNTTRTFIPESGFRHLSLVLPSLAKLPRTKINHLKWHLTSDYLASLQSQARREAMSEALLKATDYTKPMNLHFPLTRCLSFQEHYRSQRTEHYLYGVHDKAREGLRRQSDTAIMYDEEDEIMLEQDRRRLPRGSQEYGYEIEDSQTEVFGLEPQSIEVASQVYGDFVVVERGLVRRILGFLF